MKLRQDLDGHQLGIEARSDKEGIAMTLGPRPLTIDRVLLVLLSVQYVVWRRFGHADPKPIGKPEIVLFTFLGMLIVSTFSHDWRALGTKTPYQPVAWLVISYLMPAVMYWIARQANVGEREALLIFGGFALFGVYLAFVSLVEYAWQAGRSHLGGSRLC